MKKLNKTQVKTLLDIMKTHKGTRPPLERVYICKTDSGEYKAFVTDGYTSVEFPAEPVDQPMEVSLTELTKWYKLASSRDTVDLMRLAAPTDGNYPAVWKIFDEGRRSSLTKYLPNIKGIGKASTILGDMAKLTDLGDKTILEYDGVRIAVMSNRAK